MRHHEIKLSESEIRAKVKARYPHLTEEQLDEVLPAIVGTIGRVGAKMGTAALKTGARTVAGAANAAVKGVGKVAQGVSNMAKKIGNTATNKVINKASDQATKVASNQLLKKGNKLPAPTQGGGEAEFEIDRVQGQEVTLKNPKPKPGEPNKIVYQKKDLDPVIKGLVK